MKKNTIVISFVIVCIIISALILACMVFKSATPPNQNTKTSNIKQENNIEPISSNSGKTTIEQNGGGNVISKYIYGQFIEHQGNGIYGSIWAEMIEDRKFFYPIGYIANDPLAGNGSKIRSPWSVINNTVVVMDKNDSYVGDITPKILVSSKGKYGIRQNNLGLIKGKKYLARIILSGDKDVVASISLIWGKNNNEKQIVQLGNLSDKYKKIDFQFTAGDDTNNGIIEITGSGEGFFKIGAISLMPADNVKGLRADTLQLLKELNAPIYRWPGGNFASNYNWINAIGEVDKRPPRENKEYFSTILESHDFGPDEFMTMLDFIDSEAYITVSATKDSDADMAVKEIEYFNGSPTTSLMGKLRARNGHKEPYKVKFWGVGNEMWAKMKVSQYIPIHNKIAEAMYKTDPSIVLIAVGGISDMPEMSSYQWTDTMLNNVDRNIVGLFGEHLYTEMATDTIENSKRLGREISNHAQIYKKFQKQGILKNVRMALDEWNYGWDGQEYIYGEGGGRYYFKDALGIAGGLHEIIRNYDIIFMANTQTMNVLGGIKTTKTASAFESTGLVMKMYGNYFGSIPVIMKENLLIDVVAALTSDKKYLTLALINPTSNSQEFETNISGLNFEDKGKHLFIANLDPLSYNEPGKPPQITIQEQTATIVSGKLNVAPMSINIYLFPTISTTFLNLNF
ncbi:MAG: alpha-L-arabinofuranosidase C-terminal domain-containing protein [bacterium]